MSIDKAIERIEELLNLYTGDDPFDKGMDSGIELSLKALKEEAEKSIKEKESPCERCKKLEKELSRIREYWSEE